MLRIRRISRKYIARHHKKAKRQIKHFRHHPFIVPVVTFLLLFFASSVAYVLFTSRGQTLKPQDSHIVILSYDKKKQTVPTRADTVGDLIKRLDIPVNEGDVIEPAQDTKIQEDNFHVNVYRAQPVTIVDEGHTILAYNAATTPRSIAAKAGVKVYAEDDIKSVAPEDIMKDGLGQKIVITRATPATVILYGAPVPVRSRTKTVGDLLKEKNVKLAAGDTLTPDPETPITNNMQIFVNRVGTQIATSEESIPFETQTVEDATLSFGTTAVRQQGTEGKRIITYEIKLENGKEVGRKEMQSVVSQQPTPQIVARGKAVQIPSDVSSVMVAAGISSSDFAYVNYIVSRESGWCPTKWQGQHSCPSYYETLHDPSGGYGYGLCQSTPAIKMATAGVDWQTNPVTQLRWCSNYASRYGGWAGAYNHWVAHSWW